MGNTTISEKILDFLKMFKISELQYLGGFLSIYFFSLVKPEEKGNLLIFNLIVNPLVNIIAHGFIQTCLYILLIIINLFVLFLAIHFKIINRKANLERLKMESNGDKYNYTPQIMAPVFLILNFILQISYQFFIEKKLAIDIIQSASYKTAIITILMSWISVQITEENTVVDILNYILLVSVAITGPYPTFNGYVKRTKLRFENDPFYRLKRYLIALLFLVITIILNFLTPIDKVKSLENVFAIQFYNILACYSGKAMFYFAWTFSSAMLLGDDIDLKNVNIYNVETSKSIRVLTQNWNLMYFKYYKEFILKPCIYYSGNKLLSILIVFVISGLIHSVKKSDLIFFIGTGLMSITLLNIFSCNNILDNVTVLLFVSNIGILKIYPEEQDYFIYVTFKKTFLLFTGWLLVSYGISHSYLLKDVGLYSPANIDNKIASPKLPENNNLGIKKSLRLTTSTNK